MKRYIFYYDGNQNRVTMQEEQPELDDDDLEGGFRPGQFGLDDGCEVLYVIEVGDNVKPAIFDGDGDLVNLSET